MSKSSGKSGTTQRAASPSARAEELEEIEPVDTAPDQDPPAILGAGKSKKKKARPAKDAPDTDVPPTAEPPKKKSKSNKATVEEPAEEDPEADGAEDEPELKAIQEAVKLFRGEYKRKPTVDELAEALEMDTSSAARALKKHDAAAQKLSNQKATARVKGYRKLSKEAGFAYGKEIIGSIDKGVDSINSLLSMSDGLRLATFQPSTPGAVTYEQEEFQARTATMGTTLPEGPAREVVANADAVFKWAINEATKLSMLARGTQGIAPSTMIQVLKPFAERMQFTSIEAGPGLVKYAKDEAPPDRGDYADTESRNAQGGRSNPAFEKALDEYKKRVPFADRGIGLADLEHDPEDVDEKKMAKDNKKTAVANLKFHTTARSAIDKQKADKAKARALAKANMAKQAVRAAA